MSDFIKLDNPSYEVMQLDFEVDNVINLVPTQTLHWNVEYPAGMQTTSRQTEKVSHLYISNADIQGIVPLAEIKSNHYFLHSQIKTDIIALAKATKNLWLKITHLQQVAPRIFELGEMIMKMKDTEVVNTAILTGRRVAVPIKLVTVETDGQVREVDDWVTCSSTDVDVVK
eukprot:superscaffoldBa00001634_g11383